MPERKRLRIRRERESLIRVKDIKSKDRQTVLKETDYSLFLWLEGKEKHGWIHGKLSA